MGPNCESECPFPSYGEGCQMICNCIEKVCDPANGCYNSSTGVHMFLIALNLVCHLQFYTKVCKVLLLSLISEYPMTSLMGLEDKILKTELLNYEASISESKYIILISSMPKYVYMQLHLLPEKNLT